MMQDGEAAAAATRLRQLARNPELDASGRAAAYVWLAETRDEHAFKRRCLELALECEPGNRQIQQGLSQLRARAQPAGMPAPATPLDYVPAVVGIEGGVNGRASGVFLKASGMVATTSYAVGGVERLQARIEGESAVPARVIRRFPMVDLALLSTPLSLARKPPLLPDALGEGTTAAIAISADGARLRCQLRRHSHDPAWHWLQTNLPPLSLPDAGGIPLYAERGQLLGMLTLNVDAQGNALGLSAAQIADLAQRCQRERQLNPKAALCRACGGLALAASFGGRSCELCGAALEAIDGEQPAPAQREQLMRLYGEQRGGPCPHCGARVGTYRGACLRCGGAAAGDSALGASRG